MLPAVLRERNFRLLFAARTVSFFGTNLAPIAVAFAVLDLNNSATDVGFAFAAWTLAQISTLLVGGVVADRLPRRGVMIASDSASFVVRLVMGVLLVTGHAHVWEIIVLQAYGGAAVAFYSPASTGLVPETVPERLLQQANACMAIARYAAFPLGAAAGGTIVATIGPGWALLVDAATYGIGALLLAQITLQAAARTGPVQNFARSLREGWAAFTEYRWIWITCLWISLYFLITYAPFFVLGPYIAKASLGGAGAWAVIVTGEAIGSLAGGLAGVRISPSRPLLVTMLLFMLTTIQVVLLALRAPAPAIAAGAVLAGFAFSFASIMLGHRSPADSRARQALARECVRLAVGDGLPAGGLRARRAGREPRRHVDTALDRRRVASRERDRRCGAAGHPRFSRRRVGAGGG
jgi:MFS family permease